MSQSLHLPFSIPHVYQGFATARGVATLSHNELTLEFEIQGTF
jgi:hypothetical protein